MIIKATCRDNDYTQFLENYFKRFVINFGKYVSDEKDINKYVETKKLVDKVLRTVIYDEKNDMTPLEIKTVIISTIRKDLHYLYNNEYLDKNLKISTVKSIEDKFSNGEVVCYFVKNQVMITQ